MKKVISLILLLCTFTMSVTVAAQTQSEYSLEDITFGTEYSYGYPLKASNLLKGAFTYQDGRPIGLTVVGGNTMVFTVFDLNTMKRLKTFTINRKETNASQIHTSPTGDIFIGTGYASHLYRYSPETKELYDLGSVGSSGTMSMTFDDEGNVYIGTYPDARIVKYDITKKQLISYGRMDDSKQYITGLQWHDGILYYHHQNVSEGLHTFNPETGEKDLIPFAEGMSSKKCGGLFLRQNKLFYRNTLENGDTVMYIYDLDKKEWDGTIGKTIKGAIAK